MHEPLPLTLTLIYFPSECSSYFTGALEHASPVILESVKLKQKILYKIEHDLEMIVCCVFHVLRPCMYRDLISHLKTGLGSTTDNADTIKQFWEENLVGSTWATLLRTARGGQYALMKECIASMVYEHKYKKNQTVEVWWLGDNTIKAGWYPAKVHAAHQDGSYSIIYQKPGNTDVYLVGTVNSRPS